MQVARSSMELDTGIRSWEKTHEVDLDNWSLSTYGLCGELKNGKSHHRSKYRLRRCPTRELGLSRAQYEGDGGKVQNTPRKSTQWVERKIRECGVLEAKRKTRIEGRKLSVQSSAASELGKAKVENWPWDQRPAVPGWPWWETLRWTTGAEAWPWVKVRMETGNVMCTLKMLLTLHI